MPFLRICSFVCVLAFAGAARASTFYVNRLNGNDITGNGSALAPFQTLGRAFTSGSLVAGDDLVIDGPVQTPLPAPGGFDPDSTNFASIPVRINLRCRDSYQSYLQGWVNVANGVNGITVRDCKFSSYGFRAGATSGHKFFGVTFEYVNAAFSGSGTNYEFSKCRFYQTSPAIRVSGSASSGHVVRDCTFSHGSGILAEGGASFTAVRYNLFNYMGQAFNAPSGGTPDYVIDYNYYGINTGCCANANRGVHDVFGADAQVQSPGAGQFTLEPTSPVINVVNDSTTGLPRTPGCCGVGIRHGPGLDSPFTNRWRTWNGTAWVPVTTGSSPVLVDGGGNLSLHASASTATSAATSSPRHFPRRPSARSAWIAPPTRNT